MPLTHYVPGDGYHDIRNAVTACGIQVQTIINAFKGNHGPSDRYTSGTPRPGQVTCGPCAVAVPEWFCDREHVDATGGVTFGSDGSWGGRPPRPGEVGYFADPDDERDEVGLRMWAITQAVAAGQYDDTDQIAVVADRLLHYVNPPLIRVADPPVVYSGHSTATGIPHVFSGSTAETRTGCQICGQPLNSWLHTGDFQNLDSGFSK